ncbi:unnamed protein product [Protopolystoma xenopodis]|uniref:Dynein heavy chain tail domain-containing protein n=1 Tax=Protopolystoma xenopodis TaxID=117903 RepID=A0A3S5FGU7_9PLAT|nr:unnamed protein product [Protopolystoma xenopodis]
MLNCHGSSFAWVPTRPGDARSELKSTPAGMRIPIENTSLHEIQCKRDFGKKCDEKEAWLASSAAPWPSSLGGIGFEARRGGIETEVQELDLVREESQQDGPHTEVNYWKRRMARFNFLINQLKQRKVTSLVTVLKLARSKTLEGDIICCEDVHLIIADECFSTWKMGFEESPSNLTLEHPPVRVEEILCHPEQSQFTVRPHVTDIVGTAQHVLWKLCRKLTSQAGVPWTCWHNSTTTASGGTNLPIPNPRLFTRTGGYSSIK